MGMSLTKFFLPALLTPILFTFFLKKWMPPSDATRQKYGTLVNKISQIYPKIL